METTVAAESDFSPAPSVRGALLRAHEYAVLTAEVTKTVRIQIADDDLEDLKAHGYSLCFAKKVGNFDYNVVWQADTKFLANNSFSWIPKYQVFGSNLFEADITVEVATNKVDIGLGQKCLLNANGKIEEPQQGSVKTAITLVNEYGLIHPGINQLSTGPKGQQISTPIYVARKGMVSGSVNLTPVEKVLVWFEQNIATSTMFSEARSRSVEIDLTTQPSATRVYRNQEWCIS